MMNLASTSDVLRIVTGTPRRKAVPPPLFRETVHWGDN